MPITEEALEEHMEACEHAYQVMLEENRLLKADGATLTDDFLDKKRDALTRLDNALTTIRDLSGTPGKMSAGNRAAIQKTQQIVLKALLLDRENEQWLLKASTPKRHDIPRARPTLDQIQKLYRKHAAPSPAES